MTMRWRIAERDGWRIQGRKGTYRCEGLHIFNGVEDYSVRRLENQGRMFIDQWEVLEWVGAVL